MALLVQRGVTIVSVFTNSAQMEKHAGQILEKAIRKSDVSIAEVSRRLKVTRRTLYYWFNKKAINASIITNIGMAINHDFSEDYPQFLNHINTSSEQTTDEETAWRNKYIDVLGSNK